MYDTCNGQIEECNFTNKTPEDIFLKYIWGSISSEVIQIDGVEGTVAFSEGPAFVRFETTRSFIIELTEQSYNNYEPYSLASCNIFYNISQYHNLLRDFPHRFNWWIPSEVISPICYMAQGYQDDDSKYLLVDFNNGVVYFYRTATCGLCPD